jgi:hypothetical protein
MYTNIVLLGIVLLAFVASYNMTLPDNYTLKDPHCFDMCWDTNSTHALPTPQPAHRATPTF